MREILSNFTKELKPKIFSEIIGNKITITELKNCTKDMSFGNTMLFEGKYGTGKTVSAHIVAKLLNCHSPKKTRTGTYEPCNDCSSCNDVNNEIFSRNIIEKDCSSMGKDSVIELIQLLDNAPLFDKNTILILDEFQELSNKAGKATLKLLEKPKSNIYIIACSMDISLIDNSILSRFQKYKFNPLTCKEIEDYLFDVIDITLDKEQKIFPEIFFKEGIIQLISQNSDGSLREALQLLERCKKGEIFTKELFEEAFGFITEEQFQSLLYKIIKKDISIFYDLLNLKDLKAFYLKMLSTLTDTIVYFYSKSVRINEKWKEGFLKNITAEKLINNCFSLIDNLRLIQNDIYFKNFSFYSILHTYFKKES